jgi:hypothetical protein
VHGRRQRIVARVWKLQQYSLRRAGKARVREEQVGLSFWVVVHNADVAWETLYYMYLLRFFCWCYRCFIVFSHQFFSGPGGACTGSRFTARLSAIIARRLDYLQIEEHKAQVREESGYPTSNLIAFSTTHPSLLPTHHPLPSSIAPQPTPILSSPPTPPP